MTEADALSVLVVDEEPSILGFLASLLAANGIRALLARSAREAVDIAQRGYVPIDLILTDIVVKESLADSGVSEITGAELVKRLLQIRPDTRALYMSAYVDASVIRLQLINRQSGDDTEKLNEANLIEAIRAAATRPRAFHGSGAPAHQ